MKSKRLKKNSFLQGAFIATFGIVLCKIIDILYVIPLYAIIGEQGGALYGYAYSIYLIFLGISTAGIPLAMSKLISEYSALGYNITKERAFLIGKKVLNIIGIISFLILMIFARPIATLIIGDTIGGNSIGDVEFVIRMISFTFLIVPAMNVYRGYFQGHKIVIPTSLSQVLEQLIRFIIIIVGSFVGMKIFKLSLRETVGIAVLSAAVGALFSYLYLRLVKYKNRNVFLKNEKKNVHEPNINNKIIIYKLLGYAFPFIMIDVFKTLYNSVDIFMLVHILTNSFNYTKDSAEVIVSVISTWGLKLNQIIIVISTGILISLIPNLTESIVKNDLKKVRKKINQSLQIVLYISLPMAVGLSLLSTNIWNVFYGFSEYGPQVYYLYVFVSVSTIIFTITITIVQLLKNYRIVLIALISGFFTKLILNVSLLYGFSKMGLPPYYGAITSTILGYLCCSFICLIYLNKKYQVDYEETIRRFIDIMIILIIMTIILLLIRIILPIVSTNRLINMLIILMYMVIGGIIYIGITIKTGTFVKIFGEQNTKQFLKKIKKRG